MNSKLQSLTGMLTQADDRLQAGSHAAGRVWPTGFGVLDSYLNGGFRSGELVLLGGPQGLGKTTFALQMLRHAAASGRSVVYFSFGHDQQGILERLIALEAAQLAGPDAVTVKRIREACESSDGLVGGLEDRLADTIGGVDALKILRMYGDRLLVHQSTSSTTTIDTVREVVHEVRGATGQLPFVVVDYLQKLRVPEGIAVDRERVTTIVEGLKDLAIEINVPVLAVVAVDKAAISSGGRTRMHNLRGSSALAYEADTVLIMNDKFDVIARHHLIYNVPNAESFHDWVVLTIEKNRSGLDKIDLEFRKRFDHGRFDPDGQEVSEQLTDDRVFTE